MAALSGFQHAVARAEQTRQTGAAMRAALFLTLMIAAAVPLAGAPPAPSPHQRIAAAEARLAAIGYRLTTRNARWCPRLAPQAGWILGDRRLYPASQWTAARAAYRATDVDAPFVAAIARGSGADRAGLRVGEPVIFEAIAPPASPPHARINTWEMWTSSRGADSAFDIGTTGRTLTIFPTPGCLSDFRVEATEMLGAAADGRVVKIPAGLIAAFPDDGQLAAAVAHELAHNILYHRARLDAAGVRPDRRKLSKRDKRRVQITEVEADKLSVWLLHGAGYDPAAALGFWDRFADLKGPQFFPDGTHPPRSVRRAILTAEIAAMTRARTRDPAAAPPIIANPAPLD
jgi:hypothetical protein